ncbi:MAG: Mrp/NBP35 family ATP-binding protein [Candidatus Heimdallarchaeota archaeon]|nr:MAG: Mrp/NBP35 family ATP-binding protein [Candidatus Heimdallarchaeota archaeon]
MKPNSQQLVQDINSNMKRVKRKIVVLSGKGGVGKSTVAANLALAMAEKFPKGKVGIADLDFSGPNIPKILGVENKRFESPKDNKFLPITGPMGLKIVSMAFFLDSPSTPVVWRGPIKIKALRQFLTDFDWGKLEVLIFDMPPGTGDEAISVMQMIPDMDGVVIVTTPQEVSILDTGKSLVMSRKMDRPVIGVIENMSTFICPSCETTHTLFGEGGGTKMAQEFGTELLGQIPLDPKIRADEDQGISHAFEYFKPVAEKILEKVDKV